MDWGRKMLVRVNSRSFKARSSLLQGQSRQIRDLLSASKSYRLQAWDIRDCLRTYTLHMSTKLPILLVCNRTRHRGL